MYSMSNGSSGVTESGLTSTYDSNGFIWLAQQNGGGFDPVLFGDYRESQTAVVSQDFGTFFNDAFPLPDLGSPQHNFNEVDDAQQGDEEAIPGKDRGKLMTCNKIWCVREKPLE
jgi:AP-1-like transcription factor